MRSIVIAVVWAVALAWAASHPLAAQDARSQPSGTQEAFGREPVARSPRLSLGHVATPEAAPSEAASDRFDAAARPAARPAAIPSDAASLARHSDSDALAVPLQRSSSEPAASSDGGFFAGPVATIAGALAITLGLFAIVMVVARRSGGIHLRGLPRDALEVIGQTAIGPRQRLMVVRVGTQALVIGTSPAGIQTVAQFDDPDEAGQLIAQCRGMGTQAFRATLSELEREPAAGFVDSPAPKRSSLFLRA